MKAYSLKAVNKLEYCDVDYPECPEGWAIVKVKAAGICSSDIPRIYTKGTYHFPTVPGHEFSGVVEEVGCEKDKSLIGKKVGIFPLIPCKKCDQCASGRYEMCRSYDYVGSRRDGGFAEYVAVPVWNLIELSDSVPFEAAAMMEPLSVALHAVKQAGIKSGDRVAIVGSGMIAFAAAQWALKAQAKSVTVIGRSEDKRKLAEIIGGIEYKLLSDASEEYDAVIEAVGTNAAINKSVGLVKAGGRLVLMGNPEGDITFKQDVYWRILRKQLSVIGTWNSAYEKDAPCDWSDVKRALNSGEIKAECLISHTFAQEELAEGLELMKGHKEPYCKVMTIWNKN